MDPRCLQMEALFEKSGACLKSHIPVPEPSDHAVLQQARGFPERCERIHGIVLVLDG